MKKQFFRVKQLADQTFSRAGKTELLSDELADVDRHVEFLKNACINTNKKLAACLLGMGTDDASREKRLKKCPEYLLGHALLESAACDEPSLLREVLARCGGMAVQLAQEMVELDVKVEHSVVNPLQVVLETDIPSILKHKRNLARLTLDMDSARTRHATALKHGITGTAQAKVDALKEEVEDAESKVEQCRDALASEMFQLISREAEIAKIVAHYVSLQKCYHEKALKFLENITPDLDTFILDSDMKPVFGFPLEEHLRVTGRRIALPIELCVCALLEVAMDEEGLFRVAGGASKVRRMRLSLDAGYLSLPAALECADPHILAGVLKSYLRELPEPLLTHALYQDWVAAARLQGAEEVRLKALKEVLERLPEANYDNLRYLVKFLATLARNQDTNKMTPQNLAIVIAPNLIWGPDHDQTALGMNMSTANIHSFIVDNLVTRANYFFPGEVEFYQTFHKSEPSEVSSHNTPAGPVRQGSVNGMMGHTRSSSGDTLLISYSPASSTSGSSDMKRTQSNSSLTDQTSPPHSPKPVTRRKNKVAPHPPKAPGDSDRPDKPPRPVTVHVSHPVNIHHTTHPVTVQAPAVPPPARAPTDRQVKPPEPCTPPPAQLKERCEPMENLCLIDSTPQKDVQHSTEQPFPLQTPPKPSVVQAAASPPKPSMDAVSKPMIPVTVEAPAPKPALPVTVEVQQKSSSGGMPEGPRRMPVAAPRTFVSRDSSSEMIEVTGEVPERPKPAIPERPAALRTGSFRHSQMEELQIELRKKMEAEKSLLTSTTDKPNEPTSTSRPSSLHEKRNSIEKPGRPPKPELPVVPMNQLPTVLHGEADCLNDLVDEDLTATTAESEKQVVNKTGVSAQRGQPQPARPPRPQPPPPPPPGVKQRSGMAPLASESTDL